MKFGIIGHGFVGHATSLLTCIDNECFIYDLDPTERKEKGLKGMEWALSDEAGFTTEHQAERIMEAFNTLFDTWEGRETFDLVNATEFTGRHLNHKLIY